MQTLVTNAQFQKPFILALFADYLNAVWTKGRLEHCEITFAEIAVRLYSLWEWIDYRRRLRFFNFRLWLGFVIILGRRNEFVRQTVESLGKLLLARIVIVSIEWTKEVIKCHFYYKVIIINIINNYNNKIN